MQLPLFLTALVCTLGSHLELHWLNPPRKILVVAKPSPDVLRSLVRVAAWLLDPLRAMHVYVEPSVYARLGLVSAHPFCMQYCSLCNAEDPPLQPPLLQHAIGVQIANVSHAPNSISHSSIQRAEDCKNPIQSVLRVQCTQVFALLSSRERDLSELCSLSHLYL